MRILITGSRDWDDRDLLEETFIQHALPSNAVLVSGACPTGADRMAESFADSEGWEIERYPADWRKYGKRAGFVRNAEMVNTGADICLAFIKNNSRGATMTATLAQKAGIETIIIRPFEEQ